MAEQRVDKVWQQKGLEGYSTDAILGTLKHYGAATDAADFQKRSAEKFPLAIAEEWHAGWKGTGQFSTFPSAAAEELWKRLAGERLSPFTVARALEHLMTALSQMLDGAADAPVGKAFSSFEELKARVPMDAGKPKEAFVTEVQLYLGRGMEAFVPLAAALAKEGHTDDAEAFAAVEEFLFPQKAGVSTARVRAAKGERAQAAADLEALAKDAARGGEGRLEALDALGSLDEHDKAAAAAEALLDEAEKAKEYHLAFGAAQRLGHALEKLGRRAKLRTLEERLAKLVEEHDAAHPEHAAAH